ncbi:cation:proton antiporter [Azohydromonas australica]|uniref:cation:proton antiporter n=1 Tax=Azohydromonas australica TaxID=364039 RepID=UPI000410D80C|nr:sodium:proton antiporter [Azohydromonas australica]
MLDIAAICLVVTALLAYLNQRFVGLPTTIGVMAAALLLSVALIGVDLLGWLPGLRDFEASLMASIDFSDVLLQGMLSLLLFAGALHIDLSELRRYRWQIAALAVGGTLLSTLVVGVALWAVLPLAGWQLPLLSCLLFGALISPTDPIAVLGILKSAGAPRDVELVIAGESLFNDGVGVVIFALLLGIAASGTVPTAGEVGLLLLHEAGGGLALGLALGWATFVLLRSIDHYQVEVLLTLAMVAGGSSLAAHLHVSAPLAMVAAGLVVGNHGRALGMSDKTRHHVDLFWELIDEILNAVLFVLIGMEVILISFGPGSWGAVAVAIAVTLLARSLTVGLPVALAPRWFKLPGGSPWVLTWGGLRGGISVALALSVPESGGRELLVPLTYAVVVFSVLVQGLSIGKVVKASVCQSTPNPAGDRENRSDPVRPATTGHPSSSRPGR